MINLKTRSRIYSSKMMKVILLLLTCFIWSVHYKVAAESRSSSTVGTLKDLVLKVEEWDLVDSPKRIREDIAQNASRKIEQGVEEVKETADFVIETTPNELLSRLKNLISGHVLLVVSSGRLVMSWCHLLGFSTAYGTGVWVTFFSSGILSKYLPKEECSKLLNRMNMVYFRVMTYCVGAALFGLLVSQRRDQEILNKMEMFQGFNLVSAFVMILINLVFLEPRLTKVMKDTREKENVAAKKLKKINTYSSTLNVSTMMVLTWHLAYVGQLLQAPH